ncbi:hypothetical protein LX36DRAFT_673190 [Colletotrichum falcatum]|nr:hypothetical protein LX36DRAFT_673190 [Colletotrichum falcatum]
MARYVLNERNPFGVESFRLSAVAHVGSDDVGTTWAACPPPPSQHTVGLHTERARDPVRSMRDRIVAEWHAKSPSAGKREEQPSACKTYLDLHGGNKGQRNDGVGDVCPRSRILQSEMDTHTCTRRTCLTGVGRQRSRDAWKKERVSYTTLHDLAYGLPLPSGT